MRRRRFARDVVPAVLLLALLAGTPTAPAGERAQPVDARRSGLLDMRPQTQAMQRDDGANPGMLAVLELSLIHI